MNKPDIEAAGSMIAELILMALHDPLRDTVNADCFLGANRERAHAIGVELNRIGGFSLMYLAHGNVADALHQRLNPMSAGGIARGLELCWHGIGQWSG